MDWGRITETGRFNLRFVFFGLAMQDPFNLEISSIEPPEGRGSFDSISVSSSHGIVI